MKQLDSITRSAACTLAKSHMNFNLNILIPVAWVQIGYVKYKRTNMKVANRIRKGQICMSTQA